MGPSVAAVIVAAGRGLRAGGNLPKQYRELAGEPVIRSSLSLFAGQLAVLLGQTAAGRGLRAGGDNDGGDSRAHIFPANLTIRPWL
jgi:CTP:molybdopterin cytidylyltransferase MocA